MPETIPLPDFGRYTEADFKRLLLHLIDYEACNTTVAEVIEECSVDAFNTITEAIDARHEREG